MELEVFSEATNHAVVRSDGRKFPGSLVQGDSLSILCSISKRISERLALLGVLDEDLLSNAQELQESLLDRILHYQVVLEKHKIGLPYAKPFTVTDLVKLLPDD